MHVSPGVGLDLNTTAAQQLPQSLTGTELKRAFETPVGREHANPPESASQSITEPVGARHFHSFILITELN